MTWLAAMCALVALAGWVAAWRLRVQQRAHQCPIAPPNSAVLLNYAGLPESHRSLRGAPPATYSRQHGSKPAIIYERIGTAAVYKATSAKQ